MTSRERVLAAINHKQPDKVPIDFGATSSSGISAIAYSNLLKYIKRDDLPVQVYDVLQQLARPHLEIIKLFNADVLDIGSTFSDNSSDWKPVQLKNGRSSFYPIGFDPVSQPDGSFLTFDDDGKQVLSKMVVGSTGFDQMYFPFENGYPDNFGNLDNEMNRVMWLRYANIPWNHAKEPDFWIQLRERALYLKESSDKALLINCGCKLFEIGSFLRRMDNFLMDLLCDPYNVEKLLDELMKRHLKTLEKVCTAVGDVVDIIRFGDDFGMTSGPFMDIDTFKAFFKPRQKVLCDYVKKHSKMHTMIHSCGSISDFIPEMIDAGIEIFNPVQTNAYKMNPEFLKKEFGNDCTFWGGGVETNGILNNATPEQVREQVLERLEIFSKGGGFVFNPVHNILSDVPPENIVAMFDAVKEFNLNQNN